MIVLISWPDNWEILHPWMTCQLLITWEADDPKSFLFGTNHVAILFDSSHLNERGLLV
jgi:hypothetical protein